MFRFLPLAALIFPLLTVLSLTQNDYWQNVWLSVMLFALMAVSWNLLAGFTGYVSFGHGAFFAVGAYTAGIMAGSPIWLILLVAGLAASLIGFVFAVPSLRIKGLYFAIVTLGMSEIIRVIALHLPQVTGGAQGLGIFYEGSQSDALILTCLVTSLVSLGALLLPRTSFGQRLISIRSDEVAAASLGINVSLHKIVIFLASAFTTGLAGVLYGNWLGFIEPIDAFSPHRLISILAMNIVGGIFFPLGPILGALLLGAVQEFTWVTFPFLHQVFFGIAILVFGLWLPQGVLGAWRERVDFRAAARARQSLPASEEDRRELLSGRVVEPVDAG